MSPTPATPPAASRPAAVVVLAAGEGTRMRSATPKVLHPLLGRTLVGHAVTAARSLAPEHLVVVVGHGRDRVTEHLAQVDAEARTVVQEQQLGTGHAVGCALAALPPLRGTVVVTYGDVPLLTGETLAALVQAHAEGGHAVTVLTAEVEDPTGYGRVLRSADGSVTGIVEHKDADDAQRAVREVNSGIYAFDAEVLRAGLARLSTDNAQGELYLTDVLSHARADGGRVAALVTDDVWQVEGVNDRVQLARMRAELNRRVVEAAMRSGVTVEDPASTWLDVTVRLERDVVIRPGCQLLGATMVSEGALVGPDSTLEDVVVGAGASVVRSHCSGASLGEGATVGPFSFLRPGAVLGPGAKVGAFVEVKGSTIGAHSKVPHLSYVGDAQIGEHSNIGAATVFVNYDGVRKHRTVVGDHVRVGSDSMIVAPVTIGDGAYTGAGSVITKDVPAGALALKEGSQRTVEGWVERKRPGSPAAAAASRARAAAARRARGETGEQGGGGQGQGEGEETGQ